MTALDRPRYTFEERPGLFQRLLSAVGLGGGKGDGESLLENSERLLLAVRMTLSLASLCLLIVAVALRFILPEQRAMSDLVAGLAALLVAGPVLYAAWESIREPSLDGITERLIALAWIAAF